MDDALCCCEPFVALTLEIMRSDLQVNAGGRWIMPNVGHSEPFSGGGLFFLEIYILKEFEECWKRLVSSSRCTSFDLSQSPLWGLCICDILFFLSFTNMCSWWELCVKFIEVKLVWVREWCGLTCWMPHRFVWLLFTCKGIYHITRQ